ncbi:MAG: hypothetical protein J5871_01970, partial [Bacteroidales bacterium]|nr:hypothetical protein [Bacteroidales bacterium]
MNLRFTLLRILLPLLFVAAILAVVQPSAAKFPYDYRLGAAWMHETLVAKFDFPIYKSEEQVLEEKDRASRRYVPYYRYLPEVVSESLIAAERIQPSELRAPLYAALLEIYGKGVVTDEGVRQDEKRQESDILYVQKDRHAVKCPVDEVYRLSEARPALYEKLSGSLQLPSLDSVLRASGAYNLVVANLEFDAQMTQRVNAENEKSISGTAGYVTAGQIIVSKGEIVTAETQRILDSCRAEYEKRVGYTGSRFQYWLGRSLVALLLVFLLFVSLRYTNPKLLEDRRFLYVLLVFLIFTVLSLCVIRWREDWIAAVPLTLAALYLQAFMQTKVILPVYTVTL